MAGPASLALRGSGGADGVRVSGSGGMGRWLAVSAIGVCLGLAHPAAAQGGATTPVAADGGGQATLPDAAFDAALPPLDQTIADMPVASPPAVPATPPPAATDPALAQPLPPLAGFDTTPPVEVKSAADEQAPSIRYTLRLQGLDAVKLEDRFRDSSALVDGGRKAANAAQVNARAEEDVKLAERLLRSEGYYDAVVTSAVDSVPDQPGQAVVTITANAGPRYTLGAIALTGAAPEPTGLARAALGLTRGEPIVAPAIVAAEANVALRLPQQGYPFVEVGARDIALDDATHSGDYTLPLESGPKSSFGGIRTAGDPVLTAGHIAILPRFRPGELYDSRKIEDLRQALVATGLYRTVAVEPVRTDRVNPDGTAAVDVLVRQSKGPWRQLAGSAGYGTGEGIKLQGSWTHRNLFPPEGALTVQGVAGTLEQSLGVSFRRSNAGKRDRTFQITAQAANQAFDAYNARTLTLGASLSRLSTPIWQKRWTWSAGAELVGTNEKGETRPDGTSPRRTYLIGAIPLQLGYDRSNSLLDPTRGFRVTGRLSPEASLQGSVTGYARMLLEGSGYFPASDAIVIAGRARVGAIVGSGRTSIAPSRRLYSGGGGSVRGFGFQELGPKDVNDDPIGGRSLTEFALEARYRFGDFGIVPFVDAGRVGLDPAPSLAGLRYGAGIGGRYYTNFGPLRLDVATPIDRQPGESKVAVYISIGQAF